MTSPFEPSHSTADVHRAWIDAARDEARAAGRRNSSSAMFRGPNSDATLRSMLAESLTGYEIGETISRGGQGIIIKATQRAARREVAIKVLRSGHLASDGERARFEREIQILGQLRHSNIVAVHDSGVAAGLHFYVMDFIRGWPLDEYPTRHTMPIRSRLALFVKICDAVNVAHLRGVIHRDLKPGNIRVDPSGEPHVLDFGLAKVDDHDTLAAQDAGVRTMTGQFVGSLPWSSPEQISGKQAAVDVRTDVYALGVILYQLLTDRFPYDVTGGFTDAVHNICHVDPIRPSHHRTELDDDLDQIVLKALRKSPDGRYQSAGELAREIRRYLAGEPIEAKRDSGWYLLRKALRRHRVTASIAALIVLLVATAAVSMGVLYSRERDSAIRERELRAAADSARRIADENLAEAKRQARVKTEVSHFFGAEVLAAAAPDRLGREATVIQAMDAAGRSIDTQFAEDPIVAGETHFVLGATYFRLGDNTKAETHLLQAEKLFADALGESSEVIFLTRNSLGKVYENMGRFEDAQRYFTFCLEQGRRRLGEEHPDLYEVKSNLAWTYARVGALDRAESLCREALAGLRKTLGESHESTLSALANLGLILYTAGRLEEAEPLLREELEISRRVVGKDRPGTLTSIGNLAQLYAAMGRMEDALPLHEESLALRRKLFGPSHPSTLVQINNLAMFHGRQKDYAQAEAMLSEGISLARNDSGVGAGHPTVISMISNLGAIKDRLEKHAEAEPLHREALSRSIDYLPARHAYIGLYQARLGRCLLNQGQHEEAETLLRQGYDILKDAPGEQNAAKDAAATIARLLTETSRSAEAAEWQAKSEQAVQPDAASDE